MRVLVTFLLLMPLASSVCAEKILKMSSGDQYLGQETKDRSGIFVDCQNKEHKSADGIVLPTTMTCRSKNKMFASAPSLITLSPMEVINVSASGQTLEVQYGAILQTLDLQRFQHKDVAKFVVGTKIGIVTDEKNQKAAWISPDAIFDSDFAVEAKSAQDSKGQEKSLQMDKGS